MTVFISYNRRDATHARALDGWLRDQGQATFFDQRDLGGGQLWLDDLETAIGTTATAVAVLVGPAGLRDQALTRNVVAVLGRSGAGKSSRVRAGLMPLLRQRQDGQRSGVWSRCCWAGGGPAAGLGPRPDTARPGWRQRGGHRGAT